MKRLIYSDLIRWKDKKGRKPLLVRGARQIGKTWSILNFAKQHFSNVVSIDFERNPSFISTFDNDLSPNEIIASLELLLNQKITEKDTIIFFDEIQSCPRAIMALRYFYEEMPNLHVIAAGSFLEFALSEISFPVGRIQSINMTPMTFKEFLDAKGLDQLADNLEKTPQQFPEVIHNKYLQELKNYFFVGGMPECVKTYIETKSIRTAFEIQSDIIHSYRQDFSKYSMKIDPTILNEVLTQASIQVGEQIQYTKLNTHNTGVTNKKAFDSLCMARLTHKVSACKHGNIPLGASLNQKRFKSLIVDIGLMQNLNHLPIDLESTHEDLLDIYKGKLAEQFVGQQLKHTIGDSLFYWKRDSKNSNAELDFIYQDNNKIIPIEVKSGHSGSLKSLHLFMKTYPDIPKAYVFSGNPYKELPEQKITFLPLYYAGTKLNEQ